MQPRVFYITTIAGLLMLAGGSARAQVDLTPLDRTIDRTLDGGVRPLDDPFEERRLRRLEKRADRLNDEPLREIQVTAKKLGDELDAGVAGVGATAAETAGNVAAAAGGLLAPLVADVDPFGNAIEKNVLVVLVDTNRLQAVRGYGLTVLAERRMPGLGLTLVRLAGPNSHGLAVAAAGLRQALPGATVDFNHLYRYADDGRDGNAGVEEERDADGAALAIGMIDSDVDPAHRSLAGRPIVRRDFVSHEGERPQGHGTAVASLLARATADTARIYSASVFVQLPDHMPGASTESLVGALDWLVSEHVDAINMSLAGPANELLERALKALPADGPAVVAAVGNNGPSGAPMYPAAYATVIGVTAVDREQKIFRYANRGPHVAFAALGVNVKVADSAGGGWRIESGTSMASPLVTAVVAAVRRDGHAGRDALMSALIAGAEDLGPPGDDDVYGHGLIGGAPAIVSSLRNPPRR